MSVKCPETMKNLAFIDIVFPYQKDFLKSNTELTQELEPLVCMPTYELGERQNFETYLVSNNFDVECTEKVPYLPTLLQNMPLNSSQENACFGRKTQTPKHFLSQVQAFVKREEKSILEEMICKVLNKLINYSIIVSSSCAMTYVLKTLFENSFTPSVIKTGQKIRLIELKEIGVRFVCREEFVPGNLVELKKDFNIEGVNVFYPTSAFQRKPNKVTLEDFLEPMDSERVEKEKKSYFAQFSMENFDWEEDLKLFAKQQITLSSKICLNFLHETLSLQLEMQEKLGCQKTSLSILSPFDKAISLQGFSFDLLRLYGLEHVKTEIFALRPERKTQSSIKEIEFINYVKGTKSCLIHHYSKDVNLLYKKFHGFSIPDGYDPVNQEVYYFHECNIHGHNSMSDCRYKAKCQETLFGQSSMERFTKTKDKVEKLNAHFQNIKVNEIFECEWDEQKAKESLSFNQLRPKGRLSCREAMRGGFQELFALKFTKHESPDETFHIFDVSSHYPFNSLFDLPYGKYDFLLGDDLMRCKMEFKQEKFYLNDAERKGFIHVCVFPPENELELMPFLPIKVKDTVVLLYCFKCASAAKFADTAVWKGLGFQRTQLMKFPMPLSLATHLTFLRSWFTKSQVQF
jgi:hypothetical protein